MKKKLANKNRVHVAYTLDEWQPFKAIHGFEKSDDIWFGKNKKVVLYLKMPITRPKLHLNRAHARHWRKRKRKNKKKEVPECPLYKANTTIDKTIIINHYQ